MEKQQTHSIVYDGKIVRVDKDRVELQDGSMSTREVVHNAGGVCVLALTNDHEIILVRQYRYPSKEVLYELPGGKQDLQESFEQAGLRELEEETGYVSTDVSYLGYLYPTVAYSDEIIHLMVAKRCVYKQQKLDEGEFVEVVKLSFEQALKLIESNEIKDAKTIVGILRYFTQVNLNKHGDQLEINKCTE